MLWKTKMVFKKSFNKHETQLASMSLTSELRKTNCNEVLKDGRTSQWNIQRQKNNKIQTAFFVDNEKNNSFMTQIWHVWKGFCGIFVNISQNILHKMTETERQIFL